MNVRKQGFIAKTINDLIMTIKAEEKDNTADTTTNSGGTSTPTINYEDLIARARQEEKDKLYPKIKKLEEREAELVNKTNDLLLKVGQLETDNAKLKAQLEEKADPNNALVKSKDEEIVNLKKELKELQDSTVDVNELTNSIRAEEKAKYDLELYKVNKLNENKDLIPELVSGTTTEEIDASIEKSKARFQELFGGIMSQQSQQGRGTIPRGTNPTNTMTDRESLLAELSSLNPRSKEYAEVRKKLNLK